MKHTLSRYNRCVDSSEAAVDGRKVEVLSDLYLFRLRRCLENMIIFHHILGDKVDK